MAINVSAAGAGLLNAILAELIANKVGGAIGQGVAGVVTPTQSSGGGAGSKFMITLPEAKQLELDFANEKKLSVNPQDKPVAESEGSNRSIQLLAVRKPFLLWLVLGQLLLVI